jgi:undecaprenyl-diphosphatase
LDRRLYVLLRTAGHSPGAERAVRRFSKLGEHGLCWQAGALAGAALDPARRPLWLRAWATIAGSFLANQAVKFAVRRPRPQVEGLPQIIAVHSQMSYPSAHATTSAAGARALAPLAGTLLVYPLAALMALSRVYLGVHWPSDTLAGLALGGALAELAS